MDGDTADTPITLINSTLDLHAGDKVALDRRGLQWVVAYIIAAAPTTFTPPRVSYFKTATQSVTHNSPTAVTFTEAEEYDTHAMHDVAVNPTRFTVPTGWGGLWLLHQVVYWPASVAGTAGSWLGKNGNASDRSAPGHVSVSASGNDGTTSGTVELLLNAGDYIEVFAYQFNGGAAARNLGIGINRYTHFWAEWRARA